MSTSEDTTEDKRAVMEAYDDGKTIQIRYRNSKKWEDSREDVNPPLWNWEIWEYRVKKEPIDIWLVIRPGDFRKSVPFKDMSSAFAYSDKHGGEVVPFVEVLEP